MKFTLLRDTPFCKLTVSSALVLILAGCAGGPRKPPDAQAEAATRGVNAPRNDVTVPEKNIALDVDVIADFDAAMKYLEADRKSTRLNSSHSQQSRMPSSA